MTITLNNAQEIIAKTIAAAQEKGVPMAIAVTDLGGGVVASARMDGIGHAAMGLAVRKAATAANFKMPLGKIVEMASGDQVLGSALATAPELIMLPGGAPIVVDGEPVGALGVSGGHYAMDQQLVDEVIA